MIVNTKPIRICSRTNRKKGKKERKKERKAERDETHHGDAAQLNSRQRQTDCRAVPIGAREVGEGRRGRERERRVQ
jgi:hypothetical protein